MYSTHSSVGVDLFETKASRLRATVRLASILALVIDVIVVETKASFLAIY